MNKREHIFLDVLRIIACFFVIYNHTSNQGFFLFAQYPIGSTKFFMYMPLSICCKVAVPLFLMISGALLLNKEEPIRNLWVKRILRMVVVLVVCSFLYYLAEVYYDGKPLDIMLFVLIAYISEWNFSFWYLYAYLAFLITLPFLRAMVQKLDNVHFYYMIGLALIFDAVIPIMQDFLFQEQYMLNGNLTVSWLTNNIVLYPCIGYFLMHHVDIEKIKQKLPALWGLNIGLIILSCFLTYKQSAATGECLEADCQTYFSSFVLVNGITLFMTAKYFFSRKDWSTYLKKIVSSIGECTFGMYLLHVFVLMRLEKPKAFFEWMLNTAHIDPMVAVLVYCLLVMGICYGVIWCVKKVPGVRRVV